MIPAERRDEIVARLFSRVNKTENCWLWTGNASAGSGKCRYGRMHAGGKEADYVHRISYELFVGPIPDGLTIDHVRGRGCTSRLCVRPDHLEAVPIAVNVMRGDGYFARISRNAKAIRAGLPMDPVVQSWRMKSSLPKTECSRGHSLSGDNLRVGVGSKLGRRGCVECSRLQSRNFYWRKKSQTESSV